VPGKQVFETIGRFGGQTRREAGFQFWAKFPVDRQIGRKTLGARERARTGPLDIVRRWSAAAGQVLAG